MVNGDGRDGVCRWWWPWWWTITPPPTTHPPQQGRLTTGRSCSHPSAWPMTLQKCVCRVSTGMHWAGRLLWRNRCRLASGARAAPPPVAPSTSPARGLCCILLKCSTTVSRRVMPVAGRRRRSACSSWKRSVFVASSSSAWAPTTARPCKCVLLRLFLLLFLHAHALTLLTLLLVLVLVLVRGVFGVGCRLSDAQRVLLLLCRPSCCLRSPRFA